MSERVYIGIPAGCANGVVIPARIATDPRRIVAVNWHVGVSLGDALVWFCRIAFGAVTDTSVFALDGQTSNVCSMIWLGNAAGFAGTNLNFKDVVYGGWLASGRNLGIVPYFSSNVNVVGSVSLDLA